MFDVRSERTTSTRGVEGVPDTGTSFFRLKELYNRYRFEISRTSPIIFGAMLRKIGTTVVFGVPLAMALAVLICWCTRML